MIDGLSGDVSHSYITATEAIIQGLPGERIDLAPGTFFAPNSVPTVHLAMNGIDEDAQGNRFLAGENGGPSISVVGDVALDGTTAFTLPGQSLRLSGGYLLYQPESALGVGDGLDVNRRVRLDAPESLVDGGADPQTLLRKGAGGDDAFSLVVEEDGHLLASLHTDRGTWQVRSAAAIAPETWHIVGIRVRGGHLELGLDDEREAVAYSDTPLDDSSAIAFGASDFRGHLDDVKLGREGADNALLTFADGSLSSTVTLGADGSARIGVRVTGRSGERGQTIGIGRIGAGAHAGGPQSGFADLLVAGAGFLLGIDAAYANPVAGAQEAGLAVAKPVEWGWVAEWLGKRAFGHYWDSVKQVAEFVYQLTSISDIVTLLKAVYHLGMGQVEHIDGFEVTFAVIGIGATVLALVSSGGSAVPLFRSGLKGLKPVLKALFETGLKEALQTGVVVGKYLFKQIFRFIKSPGAVLEEVTLFARAIGDAVVDASGRVIAYLFKTVHSLDDVIDWLRLRRLDGVCLLVDAGHPADRGDGLGETLLGALLGRAAHASGSCLNADGVLKEIYADLGRFGGDAAKAADAVKAASRAANTLKDAGIVLQSRRSYEVLADLAAHDPALVEGFAKNAAKGFATAGGKYKLDIAGNPGVLDDLLKRIGEVPSTAEGYADWVNKLSYHSLGIKGIAGGAEATAKTLERYTGRSPQLKKLSDRVDAPYAKLDLDATIGRVGDEGVDGIFELGDGTKVFVESKVVSNATQATEEEVYKRMEGQFFKHMMTRVVKEVEEVRGEALAFAFKGDKAPILDYHLAGSWFTAERTAELVKRFERVLADPRLAKAAKARPKFEFSAGNMIGGALMPGIVN